MKPFTRDLFAKSSTYASAGAKSLGIGDEALSTGPLPDEGFDQ